MHIESTLHFPSVLFLPDKIQEKKEKSNKNEAKNGKYMNVDVLYDDIKHTYIDCVLQICICIRYINSNKCVCVCVIHIIAYCAYHIIRPFYFSLHTIKYWGKMTFFKSNLSIYYIIHVQCSMFILCEFAYSQ